MQAKVLLRHISKICAREFTSSAGQLRETEADFRESMHILYSSSNFTPSS